MTSGRHTTLMVTAAFAMAFSFSLRAQGGGYKTPNKQKMETFFKGLLGSSSPVVFHNRRHGFSQKSRPGKHQYALPLANRWHNGYTNYGTVIVNHSLDGKTTLFNGRLTQRLSADSNAGTIRVQATNGILKHTMLLPPGKLPTFGKLYVPPGRLRFNTSANGDIQFSASKGASKRFASSYWVDSHKGSRFVKDVAASCARIDLARGISIRSNKSMARSFLRFLNDRGTMKKMKKAASKEMKQMIKVLSSPN